ncbi:MAG TPA: hypothetical protein VHB02_08720 [Acidimicrobiales bacterium]|nr:hypothetical protein [Acidimicrobiales bacterium]
MSSPAVLGSVEGLEGAASRTAGPVLPPETAVVGWAPEVSDQVELLFEEARRHRRRRRRLAALVVVATLAIVAAIVVPVMAGGSGHVRPADHPRQPEAPTGPVPPVAVIHTPTGTGAPGTIEVIDTTTGQVLRSLGTAYDPYLQNGFAVSPDGRTLYYSSLDEPDQSFPITAVPVAGGPTRVLGHGTDPQPAPDGRQLSYRPIVAVPPADAAGVLPNDRRQVVVVDLSTKARVTLEVPVPEPTDAVFGTSWLPGSRQLLVTVGNTIEPCTGPPGSSCSTTPPPPVRSAAYLVDLAHPARWSPVPAPGGLVRGWAGLQLEGPGPVPGTVLAVAGTSAPAPGAVAHLLAIDVRTGQVVARHALPAGTTFLARDRTGTQFLLSATASYPIGSTLRWTPSRATLVPVAPPAAEAAW